MYNTYFKRVLQVVLIHQVFFYLSRILHQGIYLGLVSVYTEHNRLAHVRYDTKIYNMRMVDITIESEAWGNRDSVIFVSILHICSTEYSLKRLSFF